MFGYVRIFKPQLRVCEYDAYRAAYCTLCRGLGRRYGVFARLLLSYDYTFVALLSLAVRAQPLNHTPGRCSFNPLKKCGKWRIDGHSGEDVFEFTSALTAIMFYYKAADNVADSGKFGKILWRAVKLMAAPVRASAKKRFPELDELCAGYIQNQFDAEKNAARCIDSLAEPTALTISRIAELLSDDETDRRVLADFGYYLGRWIYLIDALDDLGRDVRSGSVNPIVDKFRLTRDDIETKSGVCRAACEYADEAMNACVSRAAAAYELLDLSDYKPILDNIMYLGLANSQHGVLEKSKG